MSTYKRADMDAFKGLGMKKPAMLLAIFFGLFTRAAWANNVSSGDVDYFKTEGPNYHFIYPQEYRQMVPDLMRANELLRRKYQAEFNWELDERTTLALSSSNAQIANAYAMTIPNSLTVFFGGGAESVDHFAFRSWALGLLFHETAHLYQLNPKSELSKFAKMIFGNNPVTLLPVPLPTSPFRILPLPVVTMPNVVLPTWIVEGNAVFNESRFGNGGRLYSGEARALFLSLLKAGLLDETRLTNNHIDFPMGQEKYIVGGYFSLFLGQKYGTDKVNGFFKNHSVHYFNPFRLNTSFERHFGVNYSDSIREFLTAWAPVASRQKQVQGREIARSMGRYPLNRQDGKIVFLANPDLRAPPTLHVLDPRSGRHMVERKDLPSGKVFFWKGRYMSASSERIGLDRYTFGLWDEDWQLDEDTESRIVNDLQGGKMLWVDARRSFVEPRLFLDGHELGSVHSGAILGPDGAAYAFRQEGPLRTLVRNGQRLMGYKGIYGKPVDVGPDGEVYFIGATEEGSSLFCFDKGNTFRLFTADTLVDARHIQGEEFLVVEVGPHGYSYKRAHMNQRRPEVPVHYDYYFSAHPEMGMTDELLALAPAVTSNQGLARAQGPTPEEESSYNSLAAMRFNAWNFAFDRDGHGTQTVINAYFSDPLNYNTLSLIAELDNWQDYADTFGAFYYNMKHRVNWGLTTIYVDKDPHRLAPGVARKDEVKAGLLTGMHFWRTGRWDLTGRGSAVMERAYHTTAEYHLALKMGRKRNYSLSYFPYDVFNAEVEGMDEKDGQSGALSLNASVDLGKEWLISSSLVGALSNAKEFRLAQGLTDFSLPLVPSAITGLTLYGYRNDIDFAAANLGLQARKVLDTQLYSRWFPIGLRRMAPGLAGNYTRAYVDGKNGLKAHDVGVGLDAELLLGHLLPLSFYTYVFKRYEYLEDTRIKFNISAQF